MIPVRYADLGFEGRCTNCRTWWPFEAQFWPEQRHRPIQACRACVNEQRRLERLDYLERRRIYRRDWMRNHRARRKAAA